MKYGFARPTLRGCFLAASVVLVMLSGGCGAGGSAGTTTSTSKAAPASNLRPSVATRRPSDPARDYTKTYLTDESMQKFIASMKEDKNPFEVIFKQGGGSRNPLDLQARIAEFNAFAQRYGFRDYEDYTAVWGRITVGQMQIFAKDAMRQTIAGTEKEIRDNQERLNKPNLSPEMRKMYEGQIEAEKKMLADFGKPQPDSMNDADLALVAKYQPQLDEAAKKYHTR
jgi:uncharacterized protein YeeX (DUF496 family)